MEWEKSYPGNFSRNIVCISFGMILKMGCLFDSRVVRCLKKEGLKYLRRESSSQIKVVTRANVKDGVQTGHRCRVRQVKDKTLGTSLKLFPPKDKQCHARHQRASSPGQKIYPTLISTFTF